MLIQSATEVQALSCEQNCIIGCPGAFSEACIPQSVAWCSNERPAAGILIN
uniref:Uncharacterized protein n=1 Tax=Rhizophora mucronata TaxID=61149 RepID=A0A2P2NVI3_RHIMU